MNKQALTKAIEELKAVVDAFPVLTSNAQPKLDQAQVALDELAWPSLPEIEVPELQNLDTAMERLEQISEFPNILQDSTAELKDSIENLEEALSAFENIVPSYTAICEYEANCTDQVLESLAAISEQMVNALPGMIEDLVQHIEAAMEQDLYNPGATLLEEIEDNIRAKLGDIEGEAQVAADRVSDYVKEVSKRLSDNAERVIHEEFRGAVEAIARDALEATMSEIGEDFALTQISTQLTTALSAQLPQLVVAKHAVSTVRQLLDALRRGGL